MKINLPSEMLNKNFLSFPLKARFMTFIFPLCFISVLYCTSPSASITWWISQSIFLIMSIFIVIVFWNYSIKFTEEGFFKGIFNKKEIHWDEIKEIIEIKEIEGMLNLNIRDKNNKKIPISMPVKTGKDIILKIADELEQNFSNTKS